MEIAVVAEREQIQFQALALDHLGARDIRDDDFAEIGLSGLGTQRRKFGTGEGHEIFVVGMLIVKGLKHLGTVVGGIFDAGIAQQGHSRHFLWCTTHSVFSVNSAFLLASLGTLGSLKSCKITHFPRYGGRHGGAAVRMTAYLPDACSIRQGPAIGREYRVRQYGLRA